MRIINKQRYEKQYVYEGSGIFDTVSGFIKRTATSNVTKALVHAAHTKLGKKVVDASKTVVKEIRFEAINVCKDFDTSRAIALIDKTTALKPVLTQKSKDIEESLTAIPASLIATNLL